MEERLEEGILKKKIELLEEEISGARNRVSTDRMDISFGELINLYVNKELIIKPDYQRMFRWNSEKQTALIESLLLSIPIPPIFVAENEDGVWELVDGLQRVSTFLSFFGELKSEKKVEDEIEDDNQQEGEDETEDKANEKGEAKNGWKLLEGGILQGIEGFDIKTLPLKYRINLKRAVCRVEILRGESNISMKYELFKRLNSGGENLTPQEIRNAIYRSSDYPIIPKIEELSKNEIFIKLTDLKKQKKMELYDQELILRFFAYLNAVYNDIDNVNKNVEDYLNDFLLKNKNEMTFCLEEYSNKFLNSLTVINKLCDKNIFKNKNNLFTIANYEAILIGVAHYLKKYEDNISLLKEKIDLLKEDSEFKKPTNSKERSKKRIKRALQIFGE